MNDAVKGEGLPLHMRIAVGMAVGIAGGVALRLLEAVGWISPDTARLVAGLGQGLGRLFLALLSMVVVPLVFTSLVSSIAGLRSHGALRGLGLLTLGYYLATSVLAITVGLVMSNLVRPGDGVDYGELLARSRAAEGEPALPTAVTEADPWSVLAGLFFRMIPPNVIEAASDNRNMLAVIFFALVLGMVLHGIDEARASRLTTLFEDLFAAFMRLTQAVIGLAPYGIAGYLLFVAATTGFELAFALGKYMVTVFLGLTFHALFTLPLLSWLLTRRSPSALLRAVAPALATAFSTASSSGTLPLTMKCLNDAGVRPRITSFVLPLGATINMDGTALYEAAAVLFIAQMLGDLSLAQQILVAFTALLASIGAAGIPHAGTVMMVVVLEAVGLPTEAVLTILAVDRILDMLRTTVNVWSDANAASVVDTLERRLSPR